MRKQSLLLMLIVGLALMVTACTRTASKGPVATSTPIEDPIVSLYSKTATQAALETQDGIGGGDIATSTPNGPTATLPPLATSTPTTAPTLLPTAAEVVPQTYTVRAGEWPFCIARRFDVDVDQLLSANGLDRSAVLSIGQKLTIPSSAGPFIDGPRQLLGHPTTYTVVGGDTFVSIACKFGDLYPESIASANGMQVGDSLTVGQLLQIP